MILVPAGRHSTGADLVPGDVVLVEAGDKVPADLRLVEAKGLAAQEAILTGESVPVEKSTRMVAEGAALGDRRSMLWSGTLVTEGTARGFVVATGSGAATGDCPENARERGDRGGTGDLHLADPGSRARSPICHPCKPFWGLSPCRSARGR